MQPADHDPAAEPADAVRALPRIAGYRVLRRLGLGGMAMVYLAVQESLDREVAIKVMRRLRDLDAAEAVRFEHEARIIAKLEHPGIVVIHEVGRTLDGDLYYVMPYLARGDLSVRDLRDDEAGLVAMLRVVLDALGFAHARGIVHRDVKAENVLFDNADRPQLADFGIALAQREGDIRVTGDGLAIGSSAQMSPEQARAGEIDGRSDLYSLGVLTFELLTGELPYVGADSLAVALMHAQDPIPRLPEEKAHWQGFIDRAMAKRPEQRYRNAQAMQRALDPIERALRRRTGPVGRLRTAARETPALLVALGTLITLTVLTIALQLSLPGETALAPPAQSPAGSAPTLENATLEPVPVDPGSIELARHLADARLQAVAKQWLEPAGANVAESLAAAAAIAPANDEVHEAVEQLLDSATPTLVAAAPTTTPTRHRERALRLLAVAEQAELHESATYATHRSRLAQSALAAAQASANRQDGTTALAWIALAADLGADDAPIAAMRKKVESLPTIGSPVRDADGAVLLLVPARNGNSTLAKPLLAMRDEVSRGDYAAFARQTSRVASRCRNSLSPLRLLDRRDWEKPGFAQATGEPVVCVSHADALAYAGWLSSRAGQRYRLPTRAEWRHLAQPLDARSDACKLGNVGDSSAKGVSARHACNDGHAATAVSGSFAANALGLHDLLGNVAEWTAECADASRPNRDACAQRIAIGRSWRDGQGVSPDGQRVIAGDRGYDDVGFRLVRDP